MSIVCLHAFYNVYKINNEILRIPRQVHTSILFFQLPDFERSWQSSRTMSRSVKQIREERPISFLLGPWIQMKEKPLSCQIHSLATKTSLSSNTKPYYYAQLLVPNFEMQILRTLWILLNQLKKIPTYPSLFPDLSSLSRSNPSLSDTQTTPI